MFPSLLGTDHELLFGLILKVLGRDPPSLAQASFGAIENRAEALSA